MIQVTEVQRSQIGRLLWLASGSRSEPDTKSVDRGVNSSRGLLLGQAFRVGRRAGPSSYQRAPQPHDMWQMDAADQVALQSGRRTGKLVRELFGHLKITQSITFSADGRLLVSGGSYGTTNLWEVATGRHLVTLFTFSESGKGKVVDDWLAYHPEGYYDGSVGVKRYLAWRVGENLQTPDPVGVQLRRLDHLASALKLPLPKPGSR